MQERIFCDPLLSEHDHTGKSICCSFLGSDMIEIDINAKCDKKVKKVISVSRTGLDTRA